MAHLRLFRPHRGTQSLRFPEHGLPVPGRYAAPHAQRRAFSNWDMRPRRLNTPLRSPIAHRMTYDFRALWLGGGPGGKRPYSAGFVVGQKVRNGSEGTRSLAASRMAATITERTLASPLRDQVEWLEAV